ncbi:MAG: HlyC/CorC family transporter [Eubacteriaceae bacterium]|nr:HlyC/CorC family transporter [Eubacteriaceae bacterium]
MNDNLFLQLLLQFLLIALNAFFACAEIAVITINDAKLTLLADSGDRRAKRLIKLTADPSRFLATIQVAITLSGFLGSAFAADTFSDIIVEKLVASGVTIPPATLNPIAVVVITIVLSIITLIFGELVPKQFALRRAESLALKMSGIISFFSKAFKPIVWFLSFMTDSTLKLFGINPHEEQADETEENIRMMVDVGSDKGTIDEEEKEMIINVFEFNDITAEQVSTHRTEVVMLDMEESDEEWHNTIVGNPHEYYPIYQDSVDNITGVLSTRIYFRLEDKSRQNVLTKAVMPAWYMPYSMKADEIMLAMKQSGNFFAVVIDEYGGTEGILTLYDLVEELVGELDSEPGGGITQTGENTYLVNCSLELDRLSEALNKALDAEAETVGGWVLENLNTIPKAGDSFTTSNITVTVTSANRTKPLEILLEIADEEVLIEVEDEEHLQANGDKNGKSHVDVQGENE